MRALASVAMRKRRSKSSSGRARALRWSAPVVSSQRQDTIISPKGVLNFIPLWGFLVFLLHAMRRVNCPTCGVVVEEVPWGCGKHQLTNAYMEHLARWARKLSWKETAESFYTSWDKVRDAVE